MLILHSAAIVARNLLLSSSLPSSGKRSPYSFAARTLSSVWCLRLSSRKEAIILPVHFYFLSGSQTCLSLIGPVTSSHFSPLPVLGYILWQWDLLGAITHIFYTGRLKNMDFKAALQTIEVNPMSSNQRVSGELGISQSSVFHHLHASWPAELCMRLSFYCKTFWLNLLICCFLFF